jgi:hypothetical protein
MSNRWFRVGESDTLSTGSSLSLIKPGKYFVLVKGMSPFIFSTDTINVKRYLPNIEIVNGKDKLVGDSVNLFVDYSEDLEFIWYNINKEIISTKNFLTITDSGKYSLEIRSKFTSKKHVFTYVFLPYTPFLAFQNHKMISNKLEVKDVSGWNYQWFWNGVPIVGGNYSYFDIINEGEYFVKVISDQESIAISNSIEVIKTNPNSTSYCEINIINGMIEVKIRNGEYGLVSISQYDFTGSLISLFYKEKKDKFFKFEFEPIHTNYPYIIEVRIGNFRVTKKILF